MMIIMQPGATREQISTVIDRVHANSLEAHTNVGTRQAIIGVVGESSNLPADQFASLPNVQAVERGWNPTSWLHASSIRKIPCSRWAISPSAVMKYRSSPGHAR
jgi:hypothetical protein